MNERRGEQYRSVGDLKIADLTVEGALSIKRRVSPISQCCLVTVSVTLKNQTFHV